MQFKSEDRTSDIPRKRPTTLARWSQMIRVPVADFLLWCLHPVLGPMLGEMQKLIELLIQRSIQFSDVVETHDGTIKFKTTEQRKRFVIKE